VIAVRQMATATGAADEIADITDVLRKIEERLIRAGLHDAYSALVQARSAVASVGLNLSREARETYTALRQGKDVPK